jgi:hypothetical protein
MLMVDVDGQRLPHLHMWNPDFRIEHHEADGGADKDEIGFQFGYGSRKAELHIGAGRWDLVDLQVELEIVHPADGICLIDFDGQRISFVIVGKAFLLCADLDSLFTVRAPPT